MRLRLFFMLLAALVLSMTVQGQDASDFVGPQRGYVLSDNENLNPLYLWGMWVQGQLGGYVGTGKTWYVDSGVAAELDGSTWAKAYSTINEAIVACSADGGASRGDVIKVAEGHTETLGTLACNVAGLTIRGNGFGATRPKITFDTTSDVVAITAQTRFENITFFPGVSEVVSAITLSATADYSEFINCELLESTTSANEFDKGWVLASGCNGVKFIGCRAVSADAVGATDVIEAVAGVVDSLVIVNCEFYGEYSQAAVYSDQINTNGYIWGNTVTNLTTGQFGIEFSAAMTGSLGNNKIYTDGYTTCLDPGSMKCFGNMAVNAIDLSEIPIPALPAIGTVTAGSAEDILKKLYYASDGTGAYPATAANDSTVAKIIAKGSTATASTFDNSTDSLEAISDAVRTAFPAYTNPNYLVVTAGPFDTTGTWSTAASHEIATVTGLVKMVIIPQCTVSVASVGDNGTIALGDETTANSIIAASTLGSGVMVAGELWTDATLTRTILTQTQVNGTTIYVGSGKDIGYTVATNALASGTIVFHIWWVGLDATGAVVAGAGGAL